MDLNLAKKNTKSKLRILILVLAVIILLSFTITMQIVFSTLRNEKIYKGVYVDKINASDLLPNDLYNRLEAQFKSEFNNIKIKIKAGDYKGEYYLKDFDFSYDIEGTVEKAFSVGRKGNIFDRLSEIIDASFNEKVIHVETSYNEDKVDEAVNYIYSQIYVPVEDPSFRIQNDTVFISAGHHGKSLDKELLKNEIIKFINSRKNSSIDMPIIVTNKASVDTDTMYNKINYEPVNASSKVENGKLVIIPHKNGIKIDKVLLNDAVNKINMGEDIVEKIKVSIITPEITEEIMNQNLFRDTIASYSTWFSTEGQANIDRAENLRIAADKINGKILAPGDIFSFNQTVGERTVANGFKSGQVFEGGKIVEGIGGGICQVSSTLYNTVLKANLKIVERVNHMFKVNYVPEGLDATVAYGYIDFRFQNSTKWPIKLEAFMTESNLLYINIIGTKENPGLSVEMFSQVIRSIPYNTEYVDDPNLPEGTTRVIQNGMNGAVVDTYKIIKQDGQEISRTKITTSNYSPLNARVLRGTGKVKGYQEQENQIQKQQDDQQSHEHDLQPEQHQEQKVDQENIDQSELQDQKLEQQDSQQKQQNDTGAPDNSDGSQNTNIPATDETLTSDTDNNNNNIDIDTVNDTDATVETVEPSKSEDD